MDPRTTIFHMGKVTSDALAFTVAEAEESLARPDLTPFLRELLGEVLRFRVALERMLEAPSGSSAGDGLARKALDHLIVRG